MQALKKYRVSIFGEAYSLVSDESEEHIVQSAQLVDALMREIAEKAQLMDSHKVTVLVALKLSSRVLALEAEIEKSRQNQGKLVDLLDRELSF